MIDRILFYFTQQLGRTRALDIQLEQDSNPTETTGFRFWLHISDGQLSLRVLMRPALAPLVPRGANDCCLWHRDAQKTKWQRITNAPNLITTWLDREAAPTLTPLAITRLLREEGDPAELWRQFMPDDCSVAPSFVNKRLADLFGLSIGELRRYRYELTGQQLIRVIRVAEAVGGAAATHERSVIAFLPFKEFHEEGTLYEE